MLSHCRFQRWQDSGWCVQESDIIGRRDLRAERAMSVDPPGCQDIDDAMHITRKPNGKLEVGDALPLVYVEWLCAVTFLFVSRTASVHSKLILIGQKCNETFTINSALKTAEHYHGDYHR